jgi:hypothetical protein
MKKLLILVLIGLTGLVVAASAISSSNPCNAVRNPVFNVMYHIDNTTTGPRLLSRSNSTWTTTNSVALGAGIRCLGLAVSADGRKLYLGAGTGSSTSRVRIYALDGSGIPTGSYTTMTGDIWTTGSCPAGFALGGANRLIVVDNAAGRMFIYNTTTEAMTRVVTTGISGKNNLYGAAVTPMDVFGTYKIFISRKTNPGEINVYDYNTTTNTVTYLETYTTGLLYPTYMKVVNNKLYVAVHGNDGVDIKVLNINSSAPYLTQAANVRNGEVSTTFDGWTAFDISADNSQLYFKRATVTGEATNKLYRIALPTITTGDFTATVLTSPASVNMTDGLVLMSNLTRLALSYSPTGALQLIDLTTLPSTNRPPSIDASTMIQYKMDGTTVIPHGGSTNEDHITVQFRVRDLDVGDTLTPTVAFRPVIVGRLWTEVVLPPVSPETTVTATIPATGAFANGNYEWRVKVRDAASAESSWCLFGSDGGATDFTVNTVNATPSAFTKTAPAPNADECCDVNLQWTVSTDTDPGDTITYSVEILDAATMAVVHSHSGIAVNNYNIPLGTLTVGHSYLWNISATDGRATVWADGAQATRRQFNYIEGVEVPGNPTITETMPINSATNVNLDAPIVIYFSESITASSVIVTTVPAVTGVVKSWNPTHTRLSITHDNFTASTGYTVTVTAATDLAGNPLVAGTVPNPFTFTTGTGSGGTDPVETITITREGNNLNDPVRINWTTTTPGAGVDIYRLQCNTDASGNYTSYYTTNVADWGTPIVTNNTSGTYSIPNSVGTGNAQYYKLIATGQPLTSAALTYEVVGKFDLAVGPSATEPNKFFISLPLEPTDSALTAIVGGQAAEMDLILTFDINKNVVTGSIYQSGIWELFPGASSQVSLLEAGMPYGYYSATSKYITVVGRIRETNISRSLTGGSTLVANWLATPYPAPITIVNAGLNSSSFSGTDPTQSGTAYHFDANAELISGMSGIAFHNAATTWVDGTLSTPSTLQLTPGKGYMFTEPVQSSITWNPTKPY